MRGDDGESYLACLQVENCFCGIPLGEDGLLFRKEQSFPAFTDGVENTWASTCGRSWGLGVGA